MSSSCSNNRHSSLDRLFAGPQSNQMQQSSFRLPPPPPPPPPPASIKFNLPSGWTCLEKNPDELIEQVCKRYLSKFKQYKENASMALLSLYNPCDSVLQSGPTCGLVALIMCLKLVNQEINVDLPGMLEKARFHNITRYGEMFSGKPAWSIHVVIFPLFTKASDMRNFITREFFLKTELKYDLDRSMLDVVKHVCQGLPVLVPYDADSNYEPCLKEGTRAHWAVICGICVINPVDKCITARNERIQFEKVIDLNEETTLCHISPKTQNWQKLFDYIKRHLSFNRLFVYVRQGKSRFIQIWNFRKLCKSNQNLSRISPKILKDPDRVDMIYPKDGKLAESLSNQFILIYQNR